MKLLVSATLLLISIMPAVAMQPSHEEIKNKVIAAAQQGNLNTLQQLLSPPNLANDQSILAPALVAAATYGKSAICNYLIELKADVNRSNDIGQCALIEAAYKCDEQTCKLLLENRADTNKSDHLGYTPLNQAAKRRDRAVFNLLLNHIDITDQSMLTSALIDAASYGNESICKRLVELKADINRPNHIGQFALVQAAYKCDKQTCTFLLENRADANKLDHLGYTPLNQAAKRKDRAVFDLLLNHIDITDQSMLTSALIDAASYGNESICKRLFELGADAAKPNHIDQFALIQAARNHKEPMCRLLVDCQTANAKRRNTITLLMCLNRLKKEGNACADFLYLRRGIYILPYLTTRFFRPVKMLGMRDYMGQTAFDLLPLEWLKPE